LVGKGFQTLKATDMDDWFLDMQSAVFMLKIIRRSLRRARTRMEYGSLSAAPILFANSFPKSGTHLLTQVLQGFAKIGPAVDAGMPAVVTYDGPTGKPRPLPDILKDLRRLRSGDISYGHLHAFPAVVQELTRTGVASFFIFRDPRDVVISHVHYVTEMNPNHVHHPYYTRTLASFDERLSVSILGRPDLDHLFPDVWGRFEPYLDWLDKPEVLALRFEDFVTDRVGTLRAVLEHAETRGFQLHVPKEQALRILNSSIAPEKSPTFRSGKVGKWRESFTEEHKTIFKEVAGDLLIRLGYEKDGNW